MDLVDRQEVLARFPDDGWFYFGVVLSRAEKKDMYNVLDGMGNVFEVKMEDIFLEEDEQFRALEVYMYEDCREGRPQSFALIVQSRVGSCVPLIKTHIRCETDS